MVNPYSVGECVADFFGHVFHPQAPLEQPLVSFDDRRRLTFGLTWHGDSPGHFTLIIEAKIGADGEPELHVERSDEPHRPPSEIRKGLTVIEGDA